MSSKSISDQLWDKFGPARIDMYSLPGQTLSMHVERLEIEPEALYMKPKSTAVLSSLETLVDESTPPDGHVYTVTVVKDYLVLKQEKA